MKSDRKLALRREAMNDLVTDDLRFIQGGISPSPCYVTDISCRRCPSVPFTNCTILQETDTVTCETDIC